MDTFHPHHEQVGLEAMARTRRGDRSIGQVPAGLLPDSLRRPQQKSKFVDTQFFSGESASASSVGHRRDEVFLFNALVPLAGFWQLNAVGIRIIWFLYRRRRDALMLIGITKVDGFADGVFKKISILFGFIHAKSLQMNTAERFGCSQVINLAIKQTI